MDLVSLSDEETLPLLPRTRNEGENSKGTYIAKVSAVCAKVLTTGINPAHAFVFRGSHIFGPLLAKKS